MFKKSLLVVILTILVFIVMLTIKIILSTYTPHYHEAIVDKIVDGNILKLSNNDVIQLAGAYVPVPEDTNYRQNLTNNIKNKLDHVNIRYEIIENKILDYPKYDLAIVYIGNSKESINELLLKEGMAFFDHGYYKGKDKYYTLERKAEQEKVGLWKNKPVLLYIGGKDWWNFHYADCPVVRIIKEKKRIYYYIAPPPIVFYRGFAVDCKYCKELDKEKRVNRKINYLR